MPDTVGSSLWLSLVDMLVVFAVLAFLMLVCYGLKFLTRASRGEESTDDGEDNQVDAAAGDEPASELPMMGSASNTLGGSGRLGAVPAMVAPGHIGTSGSISVGLDEGDLRTATALSRGFKITVNGKVFEVGVERMADTQPVSHVAAPPAPVAQRPVVAPPSPPAVSRSAPSHSPAATSNLMKSPLPGKILKVFAAPGKAFKRGSTLLIIEAMKMENEILAPRDCVVREVHVEVNQSVKTGESLLRLE